MLTRVAHTSMSSTPRVFRSSYLSQQRKKRVLHKPLQIHPRRQKIVRQTNQKLPPLALRPKRQTNPPERRPQIAVPCPTIPNPAGVPPTRLPLVRVTLPDGHLKNQTPNKPHNRLKQNLNKVLPREAANRPSREKKHLVESGDRLLLFYGGMERYGLRVYS